MIYLSGVTNDGLKGAAAEGHRVGLMATMENSTWLHAGSYRWWAADNGVFGAARRGQPHDREAWKAYLDRLPRENCLFAAVPDVLFWVGDRTPQPGGNGRRKPPGGVQGDAKATLEQYPALAAYVRAQGFAAALVGQDGMERLDVPWDDVDALFIGGSTPWKLSEHAAGLVAEAKRREKWAHMGRVSSWKRVKAAASAGYDSVDGTFIGFGPDVRLPEMLGWLDRVQTHPPLLLPGRSARW